MGRGRRGAPMNVVVIAPHPDDEAIGCGGAICLHADRGDRLTTVVLTSGELGLKHLPCDEARRIREGECLEAARVLGTAPPVFLRCTDWYLAEAVEPAAAALGPVLARERPELVYLPHPHEWHPDHQAAAAVAAAALDGWARPLPQLRMYEVWTPLQEFDEVEDISAVMDRKLRAVRCYRSQLDHFHYDRAVQGLNQYRGCLAARVAYAEVFTCVPTS